MNMWHVNLRASWRSPNPNLTALNNNNQSHTSKYAWNIVIMQWGCNAWSYDIRFTKPNPYISQKNSKTQKKNFKTPNLKSKCMKCMKERAFWSLTKWILLGMGCETLWRRDLSERRKYELREKWDLLRVRREKWKRNRTSTLNRKRSLMDWGSYWESVKV